MENENIINFDEKSIEKKFSSPENYLKSNSKQLEIKQALLSLIL